MYFGRPVELCIYFKTNNSTRNHTISFIAKNTPDNLMTSVTFQDDKQTNSPIRAKVEMQNENIARYNF